jgi:hypothetical protein
MGDAVICRHFLTHLHLFLLLAVASTANGKPPNEIKEVEDPTDIPYLDLHLMGTDLIDELVFNWIEQNPLTEKSDLVLAEVSAPIGVDGRFLDFVENRLFELLKDNSKIGISLVYCGVCSEMVAKSDRLATHISRGIDQPEVLEAMSAKFPNRKGLSLTFEVEGRDLVLRSTIFQLNGRQEILWANRISTSRSSRRLLREASPLISLNAARSQQNLLLEGRDPLQMATRFTVRNFEAKENVPQPLIFIEQSVEAVLLPKRKHRAAVTFGFSSIKSAMEAWSVGGHFASLLMTDKPSLINPDLYWFLGFHYVRMRGPQAEIFASEQIDIDKILNKKDEPRASIVTWRLGLETHVKYRFGGTAFIEYVPQLKESEIFTENRLLFVPYHNWGIGMLVRW